MEQVLYCELCPNTSNDTFVRRTGEDQLGICVVCEDELDLLAEFIE